MLPRTYSASLSKVNVKERRRDKIRAKLKDLRQSAFGVASDKAVPAISDSATGSTTTDPLGLTRPTTPALTSMPTVSTMLSTPDTRLFTTQAANPVSTTTSFASSAITLPVVSTPFEGPTATTMPTASYDTTTAMSRASNPMTSTNPSFPISKIVLACGTTDSPDPKREERREKLRGVVDKTWQGLRIISSVLAPIVPAPFNAPIELFKSISDLVAGHADNKQGLENLMKDTMDRLAEVETVLVQGEKYSVELVDRATTAASDIVMEAIGIHKIGQRGSVGKALEHETVADEIAQGLARLSNIMAEFQRNMILAMAENLKTLIQQSTRSELFVRLHDYEAPYALFSASIAGRRACTANTRTELIAKIQSWAHDTSSDSSPVFWLSGSAGTGKSTVAYTICQQLKADGLLGASFFCSRNDPRARDRQNIIPTILQQLLHRVSPAYASTLCALPLGEILPEINRHVNELLVQPWLRASASEPDANTRRHLVVVVDALDEVESDGSQLVGDLIKALSAQDTTFQGIKFLLTSRPHPRIGEEFRPIQRHAIYRMEQISPGQATEDIRRYLRAEIPQPLLAALDDLVERCAGLFIVAATVVRYTKPPSETYGLSPAEQKDRLEEFLQMDTRPITVEVGEEELLVDSLYKVILKQALPQRRRARGLAERILYAVLTARRPLTISKLTPLVALSTEDLDEQAVATNINRFHAVLYVSGQDQQVMTYHKSFSDFLLSQSRCPDHANQASSYFFDRTSECLQVMDNFLHFNMGSFASSYFLDVDDTDLACRVKANISQKLKYACRFWAMHLSSMRHSNKANTQHLEQLLLRFFCHKVLFWMETMHLVRGDCRPAMHLARDWAHNLNVNQLNVLMAAVERLWASFISSPSSKSTPHLYISSLATEMAMSKMHSIPLLEWQSHFPGLPDVQCMGINHQHPLLVISHPARVHSAFFSPDGTRIVSGTYDKTVRVWDTATGAQVAEMDGHDDGVLSVSFSPDGTRIVSGSYDKTVRVWDTATGEQVAKMDGHDNIVSSVSFSPDGTHIVSGSDDNTVRVWDTATGEQVAKMNGHDSRVNSVFFSPDGTRIISGSDDKTVQVWDTATGEQVAKMDGHDDGVLSVSFSPDGTRVVSGSYDKTVRVWDTATGKQVTKMHGHNDGVLSVSFSPDGTRIVSGSDDDTVQVWDTATGKQMAKMDGHDNIVNSVSFSPNGTRIISGSDDKTVQVWDTATRAQVAKMDGHDSHVYSVSFSPDRTRIVSGSFDRTVRVWDTATGEQVAKMDGHASSVNSVAFSPDGTRVVSGSYDKTVRVWDTATGEQVAKMDGHNNTVNSVSFSPDGTRIVSGSSDKTVQVWDTVTGEQVGKMDGHDDGVSSVSFSPDGTCIVSGSYDKTVRVWDMATGKQVAKMDGHNDSVLSVSFSPDRTRIVFGSYDNSVRVWDMATGKQVAKMDGHDSSVLSVSFSPDGTRIVSGSFDKTVRVWDTATGEQVAKMDGHDGVVRSVSFLPDGTHIVSGADDHTVRVWDMATGEQVAKMDGHDSSVYSVSFLPDRTRIISGYHGKTMQVFDGTSPWAMDKDGWILPATLAQSHLHIFWYPHTLKRTLINPLCKVLISKFGHTKIDFTKAALGSNWHSVYQPPPASS